MPAPKHTVAMCSKNLEYTPIKMGPSHKQGQKDSDPERPVVESLNFPVQFPIGLEDAVHSNKHSFTGKYKTSPHQHVRLSGFLSFRPS
jgi:hypothetical protein